VSPVRQELGLYIPEDDILHSHRLENVKSYIVMDPCKYANLLTAMPFRTLFLSLYLLATLQLPCFLGVK
jgi:hypothetical protein